MVFVDSSQLHQAVTANLNTLRSPQLTKILLFDGLYLLKRRNTRAKQHSDNRELMMNLESPAFTKHKSTVKAIRSHKGQFTALESVRKRN